MYYGKTKAMERITQKQAAAMDRGIHRGVMLEMGVYNLHKEKTYTDKSKYTRKLKHKGRGYDD